MAFPFLPLLLWQLERLRSAWKSAVTAPSLSSPLWDGAVNSGNCWCKNNHYMWINNNHGEYKRRSKFGHLDKYHCTQVYKLHGIHAESTIRQNCYSFVNYTLFFPLLEMLRPETFYVFNHPGITNTIFLSTCTIPARQNPVIFWIISRFGRKRLVVLPFLILTFIPCNKREEERIENRISALLSSCFLFNFKKR